MFINELAEKEKINRIDNMIENAQVNYIADSASTSKKGFQNYKQFISRMESKKHMTQNKINVTIWDKIKKRGIK